MRNLFKLNDLARYVRASITDHRHPTAGQWRRLFYGSDFDWAFSNFEHVKSEETFDVNPLFTDVGIKLKPTNVDEVAQRVQEKIDNTTLEVDFNITLGTLKEIGCELLCKDPNPNISNQNTRSILNKIFTEHLKDFGVLEKEADQYLSLQDFLKHPNDTVEVFKALFTAGGYMPPLIYCPTKEEVAIDVQRGKRTWMVISGLEISNEDITRLSRYHEMMTTNNVQSKMPCYYLKSSSFTTLGMTFVKQQWHDTASPMLDSLAKISYRERSWALAANGPMRHSRAFSSNGPMRSHMHAPSRSNEKYTFYYGGKDKELIQQFEMEASKMVGHPIIEKANITIKLQHVQKSWMTIKSWFSRKNSVNSEIMRLLNCLKDDNLWAVLFKESYIVGKPYGDAIIRVLRDFDQWKEHVPEKGFSVTFREYHATILNQMP